MKEIVLEYFAEHPEAKDDVMKAYYAFHAPHFRLDVNAHNFTTQQRTSCCLWCKRSRENVRWDDLPPQCQQRPAFIDMDIADVIKQEEEKAFILQQQARTEVPKLIKKYGGTLTPKVITKLYSTHGYDEDTINANK